jgi:hypothetical protein
MVAEKVAALAEAQSALHRYAHQAECNDVLRFPTQPSSLER